MARSARSHRRLTSRQFRRTPYPIPSSRFNVPEKVVPKKISYSSEKKDWEDATCSVCMEYPHNAVLLLCSSHDKGCRPYMCGTSYRHSNCLDQFKKAHSKALSTAPNPVGHGSMIGITLKRPDTVEVACPLCRGQVKGWTVVSAARHYLNDKKRSCMQDDCSFTGTYKELHKHVKFEHPFAKPREVDPVLEQNWRNLELERERQDVLSTIRSSIPRSIVYGDYVVEMDSDLDTDDDDVLVGQGHGVSRNILYFFLREGANLLRLRRDDTTSVSRDDRSVFVSPSADGIANFSSDADEVTRVANGTSGPYVRAERTQRRRRRRNRVGAGSVSGMS